MGRLLLLFVAFASLVLMAVPLCAQATRYAVRDTAGHKVGSATNGQYKGGQVFNRSGSLVSTVWGQADGDKVYYFITDGGGGGNLVGSAGRVSRKVFRVTVGGDDLSIGRAVHMGSRWILQRKVDGGWIKKGYVVDKLRGQVAGGALRVLLW